MVKPRKLEFEFNKRINESVICANFGGPRSRDGDLRQENIKTKAVAAVTLCNTSLVG